MGTAHFKKLKNQRYARRVVLIRATATHTLGALLYFKRSRTVAGPATGKEGTQRTSYIDISHGLQCQEVTGREQYHMIEDFPELSGWVYVRDT